MCRLNCDPKTDYFTNDRKDALATASAMLRGLPRKHRLATQLYY